MDSLSRFYCEALRLKHQALEAAEYDEAMFGRLECDRADPSTNEDQRYRFEWLQNQPAPHFSGYPPSGELGALLEAEQFAPVAGCWDDQLPRLDLSAGAAIRENAHTKDEILAVLGSVKALLWHLQEVDMHWSCECDRCERRRNEYGTMWEALSSSLYNLSVYITEEYRNYDGTMPVDELVTPEGTGNQQSAPQHRDGNQSAPARVLESLMGDEDAAILKIARSDGSADDRMRAIYEIDRRVLAWNSPRWAGLLDVTANAVRNTQFWRADRAEAIEAARD